LQEATKKAIIDIVLSIIAFVLTINAVDLSIIVINLTLQAASQPFTTALTTF
jgi:hypothetical protein